MSRSTAFFERPRRMGFWCWAFLLVSFVLAHASVGEAERKKRPSRLNGHQGAERITCQRSSVTAGRSEIVEFIESFCAEALGVDFGPERGGLEEVYITADSARLADGARHVRLAVKSINKCSFSVDESCGRYLSRPTDECQKGEEAKQGGYVADGCSLWTVTPLS